MRNYVVTCKGRVALVSMNGIKNGKSHTELYRGETCDSAHVRIAN